MGGGIVELVLRLKNGYAFALYETMFSIEVVFLLVALILTTRPEVPDSRAFNEARLGPAISEGD